MANQIFSESQDLLTSCSRTEQWQTIRECQRLQGYDPFVHDSIRKVSSVPDFQSNGWQRRHAVFQTSATIVTL